MENKDWKLALQEGTLKTPYQHFTVLADGIVTESVDGFDCRPGRAWLSMKVWARDSNESANMVHGIGKQIGFTADGEIEVYESEAAEPPEEKPYGYDVIFTPYHEEA